ALAFFALTFFPAFFFAPPFFLVAIDRLSELVKGSRSTEGNSGPSGHKLQVSAVDAIGRSMFFSRDM
ncbi:MAG TPA: hypothetical protein VN677_06395, partial [Gemmatimonadaceae bacterium]|nr:hypothetical protein [Gemmatimonadaceae bacterium]